MGLQEYIDNAATSRKIDWEVYRLLKRAGGERKKTRENFRNFVNGVRQDCMDADLSKEAATALVYKKYFRDKNDNLITSTNENILSIGTIVTVAGASLCAAFMRQGTGITALLLGTMGVYTLQDINNGRPFTWYNGPSLSEVCAVAKKNREYLSRSSE